MASAFAFDSIATLERLSCGEAVQCLESHISQIECLREFIGNGELTEQMISVLTRNEELTV
jgi:hypothetical protein